MPDPESEAAEGVAEAAMIVEEAPSDEVIPLVPSSRPLFRRLHPLWLLRLTLLCIGILAARCFFHSFEQAARKHFMETAQSNSTVAEDYGVLHRSYVATRRAQALVSSSHGRQGNKNIYVDVGVLISEHRRLRWQSWVGLQPYLREFRVAFSLPCVLRYDIRSA